MSEQHIRKLFRGAEDICLLIDASASMQPCINSLKKNSHLLIEQLIGAGAKDARICIWGYRDFEYDPQNDAYDGISSANNHLARNPFTRDKDAAMAQLDSMKAIGGGNGAHSLLDALYVLVGQGCTAQGATEDPGKWRYRAEAARCVIVITDSPFHPVLSELSGAPGGTVKDIVTLLQQERVRLSLFIPEYSPYIESDFDRYGELCAADKCLCETIPMCPGSTPSQALTSYIEAPQFIRSIENSIPMHACPWRSEPQEEL